jgi:ubiquinone/menaquinone biosynthesis C-methylase UbiE
VDAEAQWVDVACAPGLVARQLAGRVDSVRGVDITPAMVESARREAAASGLANVEFSEGDTAALPFEDGSFDGAITRFSFHHSQHCCACWRGWPAWCAQGTGSS